MNDASIPLQVQAPQVTPINVGALMQARGIASDIALRQAQTEQARANTQNIQAEESRRVRDFQAQNKIGELMKDPAVQDKIAGGDYSPILSTGASPSITQPVIDHLQGMRSNAQKMTLDQGTIRSGALGEISDTIAGFKSLVGPDGKPDLAAINQAMPHAVAQLNSNGVLKNAGITTPLPQSITDVSQLDQWAAGANLEKRVQDKVLEQQKNKSEGAEATAKGNQAQSEADLAKTNNTIKQIELGYMQGGQSGAADTARATLFAGHPEAEAAAKSMGQLIMTRTGDPKAAAAAEQKIYDEQVAPYLQSVQTGKSNQAGLNAQAELPSKIIAAREEGAARAQGLITASGATEDDFRRAGEQYALSGVLPSLGMSGVGKLKVEHYAQEYARQSGLSPRDLAVAQAAFKGDTTSLQNFQKQRDQIASFEQTAQKNLELFLNAASKIPDTGSPWLNSPLRTLDQQAVGSENMAAVNAARQVANNEIAKVTSGGGLSGVLSDAARKEVQGYNPNTATFKQTVAVANILRQDMANRRQSMDNALSEIKGRIGAPNYTPPPASSAPPLASSGAIKVTDPRGTVHTFKTQADADAFKSAAGIK